MKSIIAIIITSILLFGCSPSKQHVATLKKTEVVSVTVVDPSLNGISKTLSRQKDLRLFVELDKDWLQITTIYKSEFNEDKTTTTDYYKPEALLKFSIGDLNREGKLTTKCTSCEGRGQVPCPACKYKSESTACARCSTTESAGTLPCDECEGTGSIKR